MSAIAKYPVSLFKKVRTFLTGKREEGASLVEYALLVALIAVFCIGAIELLGTGISAIFTNIANRLNPPA